MKFCFSQEALFALMTVSQLTKKVPHSTRNDGWRVEDEIKGNG
jgi:hypothetical protein